MLAEYTRCLSPGNLDIPDALVTYQKDVDKLGTAAYSFIPRSRTDYSQPALRLCRKVRLPQLPTEPAHSDRHFSLGFDFPDIGSVVRRIFPHEQPQGIPHGQQEHSR